METKQTSNEAKSSKTPNRQGLYAQAAKYAPEAIEVLVKEMRSGDNSNARTGAARSILSKAIPDLKAIEMTGENNGPLVIRIIEELNKNKNE